MDKKHICRYCGKEFKTAAKLGGHVSKCKLHPKYEQIINKIVEKRKKNIDVKVYVFNCEVCNAEYTLKLNKNQYNDKSYKRTCSRHCASVLTARNTNKSIKNQKISKKVKLNNDAKPKKIKYCKLCGNVIDTNIRKHSSFCSDKCSKEHRHIALSKNAKLRKFGGYVPNSIKKYKHGIYNGIHYDSSWEFAYIIYNLEHNIVPKTITKSIVNTLEISSKSTQIEDIAYKDIPAEIEKLKAVMALASANLDFEKAIEIRETIARLKKKIRSKNG